VGHSEDNIAWLLRHLPAFGIARGSYGLQPVHVEDLAQLAVEQGASREGAVIDVVGPEALGFDELVRLVRRAIGSRASRFSQWLARNAERASELRRHYA
jgi:NADH dehydrogenase